MLKMILNNEQDDPIDVTTFSRIVDVNNPDIRFRVNISFKDNYSEQSIQNLAKYSKEDITNIKIYDNEVECLAISNVHAKFEHINESYDSTGKFGYAVIVVFEE